MSWSRSPRPGRRCGGDGSGSGRQSASGSTHPQLPALLPDQLAVLDEVHRALVHGAVGLVAEPVLIALHGRDRHGRERTAAGRVPPQPSDKRGAESPFLTPDTHPPSSPALFPQVGHLPTCSWPRPPPGCPTALHSRASSYGDTRAPTSLHLLNGAPELSPVGHVSPVCAGVHWVDHTWPLTISTVAGASEARNVSGERTGAGSPVPFPAGPGVSLTWVPTPGACHSHCWWHGHSTRVQTCGQVGGNAAWGARSLGQRAVLVELGSGSGWEPSQRSRDCGPRVGQGVRRRSSASSGLSGPACVHLGVTHDGHPAAAAGPSCVQRGCHALIPGKGTVVGRPQASWPRGRQRTLG